MKKLSALPLSALILIAGALLRVWGINASAIWLDEAITAYTSRLPFGPMWDRVSFMPLWHVIERPFAHGPVWALRIPALICSLAALYVASLLMDRLKFSEVQKIGAAVLIAFLPGLLWQGQDARVYAALSLLYLLGVLFAFDGRWGSLLFVSLLLLGLHKIAPIAIVGFIVLGYIKHREARAILALISALSAAIYCPSMWSYLVKPAAVVSSFWSKSLNSQWAFDQINMTLWVGSLPNIIILIFWIILIGSLIMVIKARQWETLVIFWIPFVLLWVASLKFNLFYYRPLSVLLIPFALMLAAAMPKNPRGLILVAIPWLVVLGIALAGWSPAARGAGLDKAISYIRANWQEGDALYYAGTEVEFSFDYYLSDLPHALMDAKYSANILPSSYEHLFNFRRAQLSDLAADRIWFIVPLEPLFDEKLIAQIGAITTQGQRIGRLDYLQAPDVEIWLVD